MKNYLKVFVLFLLWSPVFSFAGRDTATLASPPPKASSETDPMSRVANVLITHPDFDAEELQIAARALNSISNRQELEGTNVNGFLMEHSWSPFDVAHLYLIWHLVQSDRSIPDLIEIFIGQANRDVLKDSKYAVQRKAFLTSVLASVLIHSVRNWLNSTTNFSTKAGLFGGGLALATALYFQFRVTGVNHPAGYAAAVTSMLYSWRLLLADRKATKAFVGEIEMLRNILKRENIDFDEVLKLSSRYFEGFPDPKGEAWVLGLSREARLSLVGSFRNQTLCGLSLGF